ncbi:Serine/threonine-protein kinase PknB [Neorhodopirellula pilleata]|uniref:Serine/threonine-protein kinase PknB n=2 Tax=Neorhodopirellula pilleata TaxID=2714738 RepID=A0A5C6A416_9BACT|nr:Serine/threonine-protein kinase PknB [Neorhodopirellula pilleata]
MGANQSGSIEPESGDSWADVVQLSGTGEQTLAPDQHSSGDNDDSFAISSQFAIAADDGRKIAGQGSEDPDESRLPEFIGGYQIGKRLGSGGMGEVFMAVHRSMGRNVALKILPIRWLHRASSVDRFYEEIRAASRLMHPNIVTAFDAGQAEGIHFLAMEYVDGVTLSQAVAQEGPMSIGDATSAIRQAAFALHHAHTAGIIHRDVKPGNLMRSREGTIKLLDLGLARFSYQWHSAERSGEPGYPDVTSSDADRNADSSSVQDSSDPPSPGSSLQIVSSRRRSLLGTLSFISPEQLEDPESADARSDQYSLGATLFYLLVGHPPFQGELIDQVYGHRHGEIPDLMSFRQDVDLTLANVVRRMLAKRPGERYGSMDEVARAMAPYDNDRSTPAWVLDFSQRKLSDEGSTSGEPNRKTTSTSTEGLSILGIDLGMTHAATAVGLSDRRIQAGWPVAGDGGPQSLFRMAVAELSSPITSAGSSGNSSSLLFGQPAYELRRNHPRRVSHCQLMYFDRPDLQRRIDGRMCPAEVATSLCLRHLVGTTLMNHELARDAGITNADLISEIGLPGGKAYHSIDTVLGSNWHRHESWPDAVAITVPTCYDQLHRRGIHTAAQLAGLPSIRLIDRSLAVTRFAFEQSQNGSTARHKYKELEDSKEENADAIIDDLDATVLYVGLTGQALDVAVIRKRNLKIEQLASAGHWRHGSIVWTSRLVELISSKLSPLPATAPRHDSHSADSQTADSQRQRLIYAAKVQMAGERAMNSLLLMPSTKVEIQHLGQTQTITITRDEWLAACDDLLQAIEHAIQTSCERANISIETLTRCFVLSPILRLPPIRQRVFAGLPPNVQLEFFDYTDAARGAVACVAAELPGNRGGLLPVQSRTSHSVGFVVADQRGKRKILPIISRQTSTPARSNRQLGGKTKDNQLTLALVESSGVDDEAWQTLGRHSITVDHGDEAPVRRLGFEIDINGLLSVHMENPELGRTVQLPALPQLAVTPEQWENWREWVAAHA